VSAVPRDHLSADDVVHSTVAASDGRVGGGRVLIVVQNLPVPRDRRVWLEACALRDAGYQVSVISPMGPGDPDYEVLDGIVLRKYRPPGEARGVVSYAWEFVYCWVRTAVAAVRAARREGFDVIQACNPPDTYWALALPFKLGGKQFVFDQHDLCPEVYESRFGGGSGLVRRALRLLERATYAAADHVIVTNESYRRTALGRGGVSPDRVTVVRSGPDHRRLRRAAPNDRWRNGRRYLCAYLGVMGPQDGVDLALQAMAVLVRTGRVDAQLVLLGGGDSYPSLVELSAELGLTDHVTFAGWADDELLVEVLSSADVGLSPDPLSPLNDVSTMNKTMEYMAFELPVVAFDLTETRVSAGEAAVYVEPNDVVAYAHAIADLLEDEPRRTEMGRLGRRRVETELSWEHQVPAFTGVYARLLEGAQPTRTARPSRSAG
jgi:glycosyltransferase involved in cell wall biosynthesis